MAATIYDLYLKYANKVGRSLENDRYFQYLFEIVRAGNHTIHQTRQVLHKVVDERWLTTVEESLDSINRIIEKPRRFVATREEIVPVELAKKITADSVRHLSMHTEFIASSPDSDEVHPTKILTVSTEDSYDLYENRFIYHLIQRLVTFIDKRTDVIFWSTGDETRNVLKLESKVDDAYEQIEYKLEMSVKNNQSFAENDSDNMQVFMRIDRVRRLVMALRDSAFCGLMAGCSHVRSPIQRTNLLMKDPDYRRCYQLWHFLESYDEVGYTIEVQESALQFDEEYLLQMYTNLITNYTVFKSLMESDPRKLETLTEKHRKPIKPKFVKKIVEEIVDDRNIEDVEIRKVFVEEVTEAQLEAERQLAEQTARADAAEAELESMNQQMQDTMTQLQTLMQSVADAEDRAEIAEQEKETLETERSAYQERLAKTQTQVEELQARIEALTAEQEAQAAQLTAAEELREAAETAKTRAEAEARRAEEQSARDSEARAAAEEAKARAEEAKQAAETAMRQAEQAKASAETQAKEAEDQRRDAVEARDLALLDRDEAVQQRDDALRAGEADRAAREEAERLRKTAEEAAQAAQALAAQAEKAKTAAQRRAKEDEAAKAAAEKAEAEARHARQTAEDTAQKAEKARADAEERMAQAIEAKQTAEQERQRAEQAEAEARKISEEAEQARQEAEQQAAADRDARQAAETERDKALKRAARAVRLFGWGRKNLD